MVGWQGEMMEESEWRAWKLDAVGGDGKVKPRKLLFAYA